MGWFGYPEFATRIKNFHLNRSQWLSSTVDDSRRPVDDSRRPVHDRATDDFFFWLDDGRRLSTTVGDSHPYVSHRLQPCSAVTASS